MVNWFSMALKDSTHSWMMNLPKNSIGFWDELCGKFITNFRRTFEHPCTVTDLHAMRQEEGETLHKYIQSGAQQDSVYQ